MGQNFQRHFNCSPKSDAINNMIPFLTPMTPLLRPIRNRLPSWTCIQFRRDVREKHREMVGRSLPPKHMKGPTPTASFLQEIESPFTYLVKSGIPQVIP